MCIKLVTWKKVYTMMHGQKNIKIIIYSRHCHVPEIAQWLILQIRFSCFLCCKCHEFFYIEGCNFCQSILSFLRQILQLFFQWWPCHVAATAVAVYDMPKQTIAIHPETKRPPLRGKVTCFVAVLKVTVRRTHWFHSRLSMTHLPTRPLGSERSARHNGKLFIGTGMSVYNSWTSDTGN